MAGLGRDDLERWINQVGWVAPGNRKGDEKARIAIKVKGVNYCYGRWVFKVQPLAGTGTWQVDINRVEFREDT